MENNFTLICTILNEVHNLPRLLASIERQTLQASAFIVVDGGSTDGSIELLKAAVDHFPRLRLIVDPSCSLRHSPGPIARGRNVAIMAAETEIIACCDAGCEYAPEWLATLVTPLLEGKATITAGGSMVLPGTLTAWDIACAPFIGFDLPGHSMPHTPSGTARSLAFLKREWNRVGGFPEKNLCGEDAQFFRDMQTGTARFVFTPDAPAKYVPEYDFRTALRRLFRYAQADGDLRLSLARFLRMIFRCLVFLIAVVCLKWTRLPALFWLVMELFFALRNDIKGILANNMERYLGHRICFSALVPWVYSLGYASGRFFKVNSPNAQNK